MPDQATPDPTSEQIAARIAEAAQRPRRKPGARWGKIKAIAAELGGPGAGTPRYGDWERKGSSPILESFRLFPTQDAHPAAKLDMGGEFLALAGIERPRASS
jgi:hypothetical protein